MIQKTRTSTISESTATPLTDAQAPQADMADLKNHVPTERLTRLEGPLAEIEKSGNLVGLRLVYETLTSHDLERSEVRSIADSAKQRLEAQKTTVAFIETCLHLLADEKVLAGARLLCKDRIGYASPEHSYFNVALSLENRREADTSPLLICLYPPHDPFTAVQKGGSIRYRFPPNDMRSLAEQLQVDGVEVFSLRMIIQQASRRGLQ